MRLRKVDLNLFVVFDAIYRERSVTKVAALLNLTQSAVSNALSRLRQAFDDPLFIRTREGMTPTPVADSVVGDVRQALLLLDRSIGSSAFFDPASSEKIFRLGLNDLAQSILLPRLHGAVKALAPKVSLTSYYLQRETALEDLKSGGIDLLVDAPLVNAKDLQHAHLCELPYVLAMRPAHPLAKRTLSVDEYLSCEHLHVSSRRRGRGQVDIALHSQGHRREVTLRVQNHLMAARITAETDLLWTVPKVLANTLPLQTMPLPFTVEPLELNLYWPKSAEKDPANLWLRQMISEQLADTSKL